jgi:hypothetical protein
MIHFIFEAIQRSFLDRRQLPNIAEKVNLFAETEKKLHPAPNSINRGKL